ncbi:MAG: sulfatase-like hydrolase/transferase [Bryobacterales bacterium]|nr:sulfatase-like hydrolase/transferase [Bryobacterales bacterium]
MMNRRTFLQTSTVGSAGASSAFAQNAVDRPNFLFVITDQQTHNAMSCAANPWLKTPAMDSLAERGTRFSAAYCTYPVCSPSRGSIFTGRMPHETGVRLNGQAVKQGVTTLGEIFQAAGYETAYGGKWHLPRSFGGVTGFKEVIGGHGLGARMDKPLAEATAQWLRNAPKRPFFYVASFMNPHDVCDWIRRHPGSRQHSDPDRYPPPPGNMAVDPLEPEAVQFHRRAGYDLMSQGIGIASSWRRDDVRHYLHDYYRMVEDVDRCVGQVLQALDDSGLRENTIVAFISDHGEGLGGHLWAQKAAFYEESARIPLILAGPGIRAGHADFLSLASLADLVPTFCDYAGIAPPAGLSGVSLRPALEGKPLGRTFVAGELIYQDSTREGRMIRTARHKYVVFNSGARPEQLFDLESDPGEVLNLAMREEARQELIQHRALLRAWIRQTSDDFQMPVETQG